MTTTAQNFPKRLNRLWRIQVVFPDFGSRPFINAFGFLRYVGERPFEASPHEVQFLRALSLSVFSVVTSVIRP